MLSMRHLFIRIYAFIAMLAIFFVIGMFVFHIIDDINKKIENAELTFRKFEKAVAYEVKGNLLEDETSRQRLRGIAKALDIKGFVIQISPNAGKVFSYPSDSNLFAIINGNVLIKEHSKFLKVFKTELYTTVEESQQKLYITTIMNVFPSNMLFVRSRTVFFFALAFVLLTGIIRILLSIMPQEKIEKVYTAFNEEPRVDRYSHKSYEVPASNPYKAPVHNEDVGNLSNYEKPNVKDEHLNVSYNEDLQHNEFSSDDFSTATTPTNLTEEPRGLYSPTTGLGWKEYLVERLDAEIARATSTDQDMSFVIIKIRDIDFSSINMQRISSILLDTFTFKDMLFEYSDNITLGFAGILQDMYIDGAVKICDSLFSKIKKEIYLTGQEPSIGIGISTRACRLADAKVIITEAEAAVSRALQNKDDPIVGFKPSAEKYRQQAIEERD